MYTLHFGDCLEILPTFPPSSVDAIIADPPYGTTACKWDSVIPFEPMWAQLKRIIKPRGAIVLFGSQPFTSALVMSNPKMFRYEWVWDKVSGTDSFNARLQPLKSHENVLVFGVNRHTYNPQMMPAVMKNMRDRIKNNFKGAEGKVYGNQRPYTSNKDEAWRYPLTVYRYSNQNAELHRDKRLHPTQKPLALMEYLVKTYTNADDTVLDFTMGSGTTGHACANTGRRFVGIERDAGYFAVAQERIANAYDPLRAMQEVA